MVKIKIQELEEKILSCLEQAGMDRENALTMTEVYIRATYRSVGHHDINDFTNRLDALKGGSLTANPKIRKVSCFNALEGYDGDNGPGELCTSFVTMRSMILAEQFGIGLATIRNSNHFLSAAPYSEMAEEKGFLTIVLSKSPGGLSLPGAKRNIMGNNPFGFAAGYDEGKVLFDICCAYSSYGKMGDKIKKGQRVPDYWGNDSEGNPTSDPSRIKESGLYMPIGEHKGFGLAIMVELLTALLSGGAILNQGEDETGFPGKYSQTAISIDIRKIPGEIEFKKRNQVMVDIFKQIFPEIQIPGERSLRVRHKIEKKGFFELDEALWGRLNKMAAL